MLKSREGKQPNPRFWADFVAILTQLYPDATLDQSTLDSLYELVLEQWRNGVQSHLIARQLCSCDGRQILPSPAAQAHLMRFRGLARPPEGATPGQAFGPASLRPPAAVARIQREIRRLGTQIERGTKGMEVLARRASRLSGTRRDELLQTLTDAKSALDRLMAERLRLANELAEAVRGKPYESSARDAVAVPPETVPEVAETPPPSEKDKAGPDLRVIRNLLLEGKGILLNKRAYDVPGIKDVRAQDLGFGFMGGKAKGEPFSFQVAEGLKPLGGGLSYTILSGNLADIPFKDGTVGYDLPRAIAGVTAALSSVQLPARSAQRSKPDKSLPKQTEKPPKAPKNSRSRLTSEQTKTQPTEQTEAPPQSPEIAGGGLPDDLVNDLINDLAKES